jgi:hypothetical protein
MFGHSPKSTIEELVQESMFGIIKSKTGIRTPVQIRHLEFITTFRKEKGVIRISSIYLKRKMLPEFERISTKEIKFSGATGNEFVTYLRHRGAKQIIDKQDILEKL